MIVTPALKVCARVPAVRVPKISFWMPREIEKLANGLRKGEDMTTWINRAITTLTYMQLLGIKFSDVISHKQAAQTRKRAREEFGIELPD